MDGRRQVRAVGFLSWRRCWGCENGVSSIDDFSSYIDCYQTAFPTDQYAAIVLENVPKKKKKSGCRPCIPRDCFHRLSQIESHCSIILPSPMSSRRALTLYSSSSSPSSSVDSPSTSFQSLLSPLRLFQSSLALAFTFVFLCHVLSHCSPFSVVPFQATL